MKLKILESAIEDLHRGREFYAHHGENVGEYYLVEEEIVILYRVLDLRRNPKFLRDSLFFSDQTE